MTSEPVDRRAARVLLLDRQGRLLLLRWSDPRKPESGTWWITPGGGLEGDEVWETGAVRELFEETGLRLEASSLGEPVLEREIEVELDGVRYRQHERFFLARVASHDVDTSGFTELESATVHEHRWWTIEALASTTEQVSPRNLLAVLGRVAC